MSAFTILCQKYFETQNIYKILGVQKNCTEKQVDKAYKQLCLKIHPDRVSRDRELEACEQFKIVTKIKQILLDPQAKATYDQSGRVAGFFETIDNREADAACTSRTDLQQIRNLYKGIYKRQF